MFVKIRNIREWVRKICGVSIKIAKIVKIAANIVACTFDEGATAYLLVMHSFNIDINRDVYWENQDQDSAEIRMREGRISKKY